MTIDLGILTLETACLVRGVQHMVQSIENPNSPENQRVLMSLTR